MKRKMRLLCLVFMLFFVYKPLLSFDGFLYGFIFATAWCIGYVQGIDYIKSQILGLLSKDVKVLSYEEKCEAIRMCVSS